MPHEGEIQFAVKTDQPGVKVSWQVTGIRQDARANAHRIQGKRKRTRVKGGSTSNPSFTARRREKVSPGRGIQKRCSAPSKCVKHRCTPP
jgi:hypothetical protein